MRPPFSSVNQYTQAAVKQHTHNTLKVPINNGYPYIVLRKNSYIQCAISVSKQAYQNSQLDHCQKRCRPTNNGHFKQTRAACNTQSFSLYLKQIGSATKHKNRMG